MAAAGEGYEGMVKLLLETGKAEVDLKGRFISKTPLLGVAESGHEAIVKLLLETGKVKMNVEDNYS